MSISTETKAAYRKFTGDDESFPLLRQPFEHNGCTYYTDWHVLVVVDGVGFEENAIQDQDDSFVKMVIDCLNEAFEAAIYGEFVDPPATVFEKEKCRYCKGTGKLTECEECDGEGYIEFETDFNSYSVECKSCDGEGTVSGGSGVCNNCGGEGVVIESAPLEFGKSAQFKLNSVLVEKLLSLPSIKINTNPNNGTYAIEFNGGKGVVMGMRA